MVLSGSSEAIRKAQRRRNSAFMAFVLAGGVLLLGVAGFAVYSELRPVPLRIAVGPANSDDVKLVQGLAQAFARERSSVRLTVMVTEGAQQSVALLAGKKVDLAVGRGDLDMPNDAQSVAILRKNVAVLWAPPPAKAGKKTAAVIKTIDDLAGRKVAVVGRTEANVKLLRVILTESGVPPDKVTVVQFPGSQIAEMARDPTLDAFMAVGPLTSKITAEAIAATARSRGEPKFIPIDVGDAIAQKHPIYESQEIPGSTFNSAPARPDDKIDTVSVNHLIVAPKSLSDVTVAEFARQLFAARQSLAKELPQISSIQAPDTDKDAALPAHRGAAAYIDGTERTFLERYSDYLWGGVLLLSGLGSGAAWFRTYLRRDEKAESDRLRNRALVLIGAARAAGSTGELDDMQREIDEILAETLAFYDDGAIEDLGAFALVLEQFHHAVADRRKVLGEQPGGPSVEQHLYPVADEPDGATAAAAE